jgi:hypothetical protein
VRPDAPLVLPDVTQIVVVGDQALELVAWTPTSIAPIHVYDDW